MLSAYPPWLCFKVREACLSGLSSHRNRVRLYQVWTPFHRKLCFWHSPGTHSLINSYRWGCWKTCGCWIRLHLTVLSFRPVWFLLSFLLALIVWKSVFLISLFWVAGPYSLLFEAWKDKAGRIINQVRTGNRPKGSVSAIRIQCRLAIMRFVLYSPINKVWSTQAPAVEQVQQRGSRQKKSVQNIVLQ